MEVKKRHSAFDPQAVLSGVGTGRTLMKFVAGESIFTQGDAANAVFYLQKGNAKVAVQSKTGKEAVLALLGPGDFFGEGSLNGQPLRLATVTAMTECAVTCVEKATMMRLLHDEVKFADVFISYLLYRNSRVEEEMVDQLFNLSEMRLARTLLRLANFGKEEKPEPVIANISQEMLADMIGTTRSGVSFFMNKFRRLGLIDYDGEITVHTSLLNMVLHDGSPSLDLK
jgi:CRP/FNR family cyclic AMP-dependent transcriptional regulator